MMMMMMEMMMMMMMMMMYYRKEMKLVEFSDFQPRRESMWRKLEPDDIRHELVTFKIWNAGEIQQHII